MQTYSNAEIMSRIDGAIAWINKGFARIDDLIAVLPEAVDGPGYMWCGRPYAIVADGRNSYQVIRADGAEHGAIVSLEDATKVVGNVKYGAWAVEIAMAAYILDGYVSHRRIISAFQEAKRDRKKASRGLVGVLEEVHADLDADAFIDAICA